MLLTILSFYKDSGSTPYTETLNHVLGTEVLAPVAIQSQPGHQVTCQLCVTKGHTDLRKEGRTGSRTRDRLRMANKRK